jgi:outer membrane protein
MLFMNLRPIVAALIAVPSIAFAQTPERLSLKDAETRAVENHPSIRAGQYAALGAGEVVREVRASYFPALNASFTGAQASAGSAIAAGALNNSTVLDRFSYGFYGSQMLTDFGRTPNLSASANLKVSAAEQNVTDRKAIVILGVDRAYFDTLRAQAVLRVAEQTVSARQTVVDQVTALASTGLKSSLDVSFAKVNLAAAQLLLIQSKNDVQASFARLSAAMGAPQSTAYELMDEALPAEPPSDSKNLIDQALKARPDVERERLATESASRFAKAERDLWLPTISLIGAGGLTPYHQVGLNSNYSAVGVNVSVPVANGSLFSARHAQALFQLSEQQQKLQDLENGVARDTQVAWLDAQTAYQRLALTSQLLSQTTDALDLAQQRYNLGLSSIVELTQAQLNLTSAQIEDVTARYAYQAQSAALRFQTGQLK